VQANFYVGEMPTPNGEPALVESQTSLHFDLAEQCSTCHMWREDFVSEIAPAISGHTFTVDHKSCLQCHPNPQALLSEFEEEIQAGLDDIIERLGAQSEWEYSTQGGPPESSDDDNVITQADLPDEIKQVRFLYYYILNDGSMGVHNPDYVRAILERADELLTSIGRPPTDPDEPAGD
jgi:hypothetical protein